MREPVCTCVRWLLSIFSFLVLLLLLYFKGRRFIFTCAGIWRSAFIYDLPEREDEEEEEEG